MPGGGGRWGMTLIGALYNMLPSTISIIIISSWGNKNHWWTWHGHMIYPWWLDYMKIFWITSTIIISLNVLQNQNTSEYVFSLASRLNSDSLQGTKNLSSTPVVPPAQTDKGSQPQCNLCQAGSCGIEAIASSQSETYSFYAKTAPRDDDDG